MTVERRARLEEPAQATRPVHPGERLIEGCQGLVRSLAWKVHQKVPPSVDLEDLVAFGQVGLVEAARAFDPARGGRFTTYAYYRIRGAILDGLSRLSWFSRRDYHACRYERMANEVLALEAANGEPGGGTLQEESLWLRDVSRTLAVVYLATGPEGEEMDLEDRAAPSPAALAMEGELRDSLHGLIEALPADAGRLVRDIYFEGLSLTEAGERLGISRAWASRLHSKTLKRLARALRLIGAAD